MRPEARSPPADERHRCPLRTVSDDAQVAAMVDRAVAEFGRLDAAFNNAGVMAALLQLPTAPARNGTA